MSIKKILFLMAAVVLCCLPPVTSALSLGDLHAFSRQGEPLEAEVNLVSFNPNTRLEQIKVSVPPLAMFKRFNLRRHAFLDRIRFTSVQTRDGFLIKLASADAMPAKPVDLLLEIEINGERTLKQYRLALPSKRATLPRALPVPEPANALSKKVPQHVAFANQQQVVRPAAKPVASQRNIAAKNARSLPVPVAQPQPKRTVVKQAVTRKINTKKPVVVANTRSRQPNKPQQPVRQIPKQVVKQPVQPRVQNSAHTANQAQQLINAGSVANSNSGNHEPFVYENWQADQAEYTDNYISFVTPPPVRATHYTIKRGDTLSKIAARHKPADVTLDQMLFALYQQNSAQLPTIEKIDKLYVGQRLKLPTPQEVRAVSRIQGRQFKQAYLDKHRQRLAKKRAAEKKVQLAKEQAVKDIKLAQQYSSTVQSNATDQTKSLLATKPVRPAGLAQMARPVKQPVAKSVQIFNSDNTDAVDPANNQVSLLEGRLRKVKRLLEIEKQQHATTKKVVKEKNRLIQRKDNMIQDLQVAGVKGNKAQNDDAIPPATKNLTQAGAKDKRALTMAALDSSASSPIEATVASDGNKLNAVVNEVESLPADAATIPASFSVFWAETWPLIKDFFVKYPVLSVLLPLIALLGLLMLLFKPGRKKHAAIYTEHEPLHVAASVEPAVDYGSPSQQQNNTPPDHELPDVPAAQRVSADSASSKVPPADSYATPPAANQMQHMAVTPPTPAGNDAVSMSGHGPQTVVINISAPAKLSIDMSAEGQQLDLLRQQTDKLKESLRSLENSTRMLSRLNTSDAEA